MEGNVKDLSGYRFEKARKNMEIARILYEKLGFQHEGMLRKNCRKNGMLYDVHLMSMLAEEWDEQGTGEAE